MKHDETHPGGLFRVGDRVVDAEGRDLGDEGIALADKRDQEARDQAKAEQDKARENAATVASGGLGQLVQALTAAVSGRPNPETANVGVTEPSAASQEVDVNAARGEPAANISTSGPTPVPDATGRTAPDSTTPETAGRKKTPKLSVE